MSSRPSAWRAGTAYRVSCIRQDRNEVEERIAFAHTTGREKALNIG